jgi:hypothetical protein
VVEGPTAEEGAADALTDDGSTASRTDWRGIDALGETVGGYCWLEHRLFEVTGSWAVAKSETAIPAEMRVFFAALSRRHGSLAERWSARLPVRAGVDASALVKPPPGLSGDVAACLSETDIGASRIGEAQIGEAATQEAQIGEAQIGEAATGAARCLDALVEILLPWLAGEYQAHLAVASPVREGPVIEVLLEARRAAVAEVEGGRRLLERLGEHGANNSGSPSP